MAMKIVSLCVFALASNFCYGQMSSEVQNNSTNPRHITTHCRDSLEAWSAADAAALTKSRNGDIVKYDYYYLNNELFNGWSKQLFKNNDHRYRYSLYENGLMVRQIAYYANEQLDADFQMMNGRNAGSARMWHADGKLYIDTFCDNDGNPDGLQWKWHSNGEVARKALYEKGTMIYELLYDSNGVLTEKRGKVPRD